MSTPADRLTQLQKELDTLRQIQTQEDYDEGARLHAEKNAPWVNGMYSHLKFPPYEFKMHPKSLYGVNYGPCRKALQDAEGMLVSGNDMSRELAIKGAQRDLDACVVVARSAEDEAIKVGQGWCVGIKEAEARRLGMENEIATQAAHLNYEDRNLTGAALAERELADDLSEGHLVDVTGTLEKAKARKARQTVSV